MQSGTILCIFKPKGSKSRNTNLIIVWNVLGCITTAKMIISRIEVFLPCNNTGECVMLKFFMDKWDAYIVMYNLFDDIYMTYITYIHRLYMRSIYSLLLYKIYSIKTIEYW